MRSRGAWSNRDSICALDLSVGSIRRIGDLNASKISKSNEISSPAPALIINPSAGVWLRQVQIDHPPYVEPNRLI